MAPPSRPARAAPRGATRARRRAQSGAKRGRARRPAAPTAAPVLAAIRREFRDSLPEILAGRDPAARLDGYGRFLRIKYGIALPLAGDGEDGE